MAISYLTGSGSAGNDSRLDFQKSLVTGRSETAVSLLSSADVILHFTLHARELRMYTYIRLFNFVQLVNRESRAFVENTRMYAVCRGRYIEFK